MPGNKLAGIVNAYDAATGHYFSFFTGIRNHTMLKRNIIFISLLLLLLAGLGLIKYQQIQQGVEMMMAGAPPPTSVEVIAAKNVQWQPRIAAVGTLTAHQGIDVSNEVEGVVKSIHIESGQKVASGTLLVTLDDAVEQADLASLKAQEELALTVFKRNRDMWKKRPFLIPIMIVHASP